MEDLIAKINLFFTCKPKILRHFLCSVGLRVGKVFQNYMLLGDDIVIADETMALDSFRTNVIFLYLIKISI